MNRYEQEYQKQLELLEKQIEMAKISYEKAKAKYETIKNDPSINNWERKLEACEKNLKVKIYALSNLIDQQEFMRVGSEETEQEKMNVYRNFSKELKEKLSKESTLCFHGCSHIYRVKAILKQGQISSSVDRLGFQTSYDVDEQVSVTTRSSIDVTMESYVGLTSNSSFPAGALFVIKPKDEQKIESSKSLLIGNVDFKTNPERLVAIISTSENKKRIIEWCKASGVLKEKVYTFDEFLNVVDEITENMNVGKTLL